MESFETIWSIFKDSTYFDKILISLFSLQQNGEYNEEDERSSQYASITKWRSKKSTSSSLSIDKMSKYMPTIK